MQLVPAHHTRLLVVALAIGCAKLAPAQSIDVGRYRLVDLTHAFAPSTLYWPTSPSGFRLEQLA